MLSQVDSGELIRCKEMVDEYLHSLEFSLPANAVYIFNSAQIRDEEEEERDQSSKRHLRQTRRGRCSGEQGDCDEYYDGFRCLYNEEGHNAGGLQKNASPCPPLHPAIN